MTWPLAITVGIIGAAAVLEGLLAGPKPQAVLKSLRQPSWSPPFPLWVAIGLLYYVIFGTVLFRLLSRPASWTAVALVLIGAILLINSAWNFLLFRRRDLRAARLALVPYGAMVAGLFLSFLLQDRTAALILVPYLLYLPFAYIWVRALERLNAGSRSQ